MASTEEVGVVAMVMITVMVAGVATMKSRTNTVMVNNMGIITPLPAVDVAGAEEWSTMNTLMASQMSIIRLQAVGVAGEEGLSRMNTSMVSQMSILLLQAVGVAGEEGWSKTNTSMVNQMSIISLQAVVVALEEGEDHGVREAVAALEARSKLASRALMFLIIC